MQLSYTYIIILNIKFYVPFFFRAIETLHLTNTIAAVLVRQKGINKKYPEQKIK